MISWYFYQDPPEASDIYELLLRACVQDGGCGRPGIVAGLLKAYISSCDDEDEEHPDNLTFLDSEEAEKYYKKMFIQFHKSFSKSEYDEEGCEHWFPESLGYGQGHAYPKNVLQDVAKIMASTSVMQDRALYAYWSEKEAEKAVEGVKND